MRAAIHEVERIRIKLEELVRDMDRVLEYLKKAEETKEATEEEIESLRGSLRSLHR